KAYYSRAFLYADAGETAKAIADFDAAIRLDPKEVNFYMGRGVAKFGAGQFGAAADDFAQAGAIHPDDQYPVLWRYLAHARAGSNEIEEVRQQAAKLDLSRWPGPVTSLYIGTIEVDAVVASVTSNEPTTKQGQKCEADFYIAELQLLQKDDDEAK